MTHLQNAIEFRKCMTQPVGTPSVATLALQTRLIAEETEELCEATRILAFDLTNKRAREDALKELADVAYVAYQLAAACGWDLDEALNRVHASNMSKLENGAPVKDEQGKVLKGKNYQPPSLINLV